MLTMIGLLLAGAIGIAVIVALIKFIIVLVQEFGTPVIIGCVVILIIAILFGFI